MNKGRHSGIRLLDTKSAKECRKQMPKYPWLSYIIDCVPERDDLEFMQLACRPTALTPPLSE